MASKKCKEHSYVDLPLTARNGRKYQKCIVCRTVTFCKGYESPPKPKAVSQPIVQVSMVSEHYGVPRATNSDGTEYYLTKKSRRKGPKIAYLGIWA